MKKKNKKNSRRYIYTTLFFPPFLLLASPFFFLAYHEYFSGASVYNIYRYNFISVDQQTWVQIETKSTPTEHFVASPLDPSRLASPVFHFASNISVPSLLRCHSVYSFFFFLICLVVRGAASVPDSRKSQKRTKPPQRDKKKKNALKRRRLAEACHSAKSRNKISSTTNKNEK